VQKGHCGKVQLNSPNIILFLNIIFKRERGGKVVKGIQ
jgi:hypothetical protein